MRGQEPKPRIAVLANAGLGGTEKAAAIYAVALVERGYQVDYITEQGPRTHFLREHGVQVIQILQNPNALCAYIERSQPQIIHQHVPGYPFGNPLYVALTHLGGIASKP